MIYNSKLLIALLGVAVGTTAANAESIGYVSLGFSSYEAENDGDSGRGTAKFLEGSYAFGVGATGTIAFDLSLRTDDMEDAFYSADTLTRQYQIAAHYLHDLNNGAKLGTFISYGSAPHEDADEAYKTILGGLEVIYPVSGAVVAYGQLGIGDARNPTADSSGFESGKFLRAGVRVSPWERTAISMEFEFAESDEYEDDDEPGLFRSFYLGGETSLNSAGNLSATYGVRTAWFDAKNDNNYVDETSVNLGLRYVFGGKKASDVFDAGLIGTPYLPTRAPNWTPSMD